MTQAYGEAWYWDKRYAKESTTTFDWYQKYESLSPLLHLYISTSTTTRPRVLVVGCGNSAFSEGMIKDGYTDIVNIDISSVVIEAMQKKYSDSLHLKYIEMDVRDMKDFETGSFDAVIDKGTLDSLLKKYPKSTHLPLSGPRMSTQRHMIRIDDDMSFLTVWSQFKTKCCQDVGGGRKLITNYRVLKKEGVYILITYGIPAYRLRLLKESHSWAIKLHVIDKLLPGESSKGTWELTRPVPLNSDGSLKDGSPLENMDVHYIYVCTKV